MSLTSVRNLTFAVVLTTSLLSQAKVYLNSMCYLQSADKTAQVSGDKNKTKKFPLASISKVATTLWALDVYGANYRFKTQIHVTPVADKTYDVHIEGSRYPFMGQKMGYVLISELNKLGITQVRKLTFDENFTMAWSLEDSHIAYGETPIFRTYEEQADFTFQQIQGGLLTDVQKSQYALTKKTAEKMGLVMTEKPTLDAKEVLFVSSQAFKASATTKSYAFQSSPLHVLLKQMNNQSNNYIADNLFINMGGTEKFNEYITKKLSVAAKDFEFVNGSGNNHGTTGAPIYNRASCEFMIQIMVALDKVSTNQQIKLTDILGVAGVDSESTVHNFNGTVSGSSVMKTGSVNKAKTLSGAISTKKGLVFFSILYHTDRDINPADWGIAQSKIKIKLNELAKKVGNVTEFQYTEIDTQPYDKESAFKQIESSKLGASLK